MKYKFSWGVGITIFYSVFVLFLIANVVFSFFQQTDLVTDDYYGEELVYQEKIHKLERTKRLSGGVNFIRGASTIAIQFPESVRGKNINGDIYLYRPANSSSDKKIKLIVNENNFQTINTMDLEKGLWILKIDWSVGDSTYYNEEKVIL